jgi:hypothetical protein
LNGPWFEGYDWLHVRESVNLEKRDTSLDGKQYTDFAKFSADYAAFLDSIETQALELFRVKLEANGEGHPDVIKDTVESTLWLDFMGGRYLRPIQFRAITAKHCYTYGAFYASEDSYARASLGFDKIQRYHEFTIKLFGYRAGLSCAQTLRAVIEEEMLEHGERWEDILVSTELQDFYLQEHTGLDYRPFTIWTKSRIYFEHTHRQAWDHPSITQVRSLPRLPMQKSTKNGPI